MQRSSVFRHDHSPDSRHRILRLLPFHQSIQQPTSNEELKLTSARAATVATPVEITTRIIAVCPSGSQLNSGRSAATDIADCKHPDIRPWFALGDPLIRRAGLPLRCR